MNLGIQKVGKRSNLKQAEKFGDSGRSRERAEKEFVAPANLIGQESRSSLLFLLVLFGRRGSLYLAFLNMVILLRILDAIY